MKLRLLVHVYMTAVAKGHSRRELQVCGQVSGSSPGWAPWRGGLGQATYTCVPVSMEYNLVPVKGNDLFGWESNRWLDGK